MRLHFPDREHGDVEIHSGRLVLGRIEGVDVRVDSPAVSERHAYIDYEPVRGLTLEVASPGAEVHVNGRRVEQRAILHLGDLITLGPVRVLLTEAPGVRPPPPKAATAGSPPARTPPQRALLRGQSGPLFGKVIPLQQRTVIGNSADCDLVLNEPTLAPRHAEIENGPDGLVLRDLTGRGGIQLNGLVVRDAVLKPGDQIAFGPHRFLLEAPGYVAPDRHVTPQAVPAPAHTGVHRPIVIPPPPAVQAAEARQRAQEEAQESRLANAVLIGAALVILLSLAAVALLSLQRG